MTKGLILMGWPLIAHTVGAIVMTLSDRLILEKMTTTEDVGIYSLGANLGAAVLIVCTAFNLKWGPWMHKQLNDITEAKKKKIVRYTYLYFLVVIFATFGVAGAGVIYIHYLIDPSYAQAADYVLWIAGGTGFFGMSLAINHYLIVKGKTTVLPLITGFAAILNIALTIWLITINGPIGAAQATFITYVFHFFAMWYMNNKHYPMPWLGAFKKS
jgi:O-antigen/teichoic acid export membrane protein